MGEPAVVVVPPQRDDESVPATDSAEVSLLDDRFEPRTITVAAGTRVTWLNRGRGWHSVAAFDGSFESGKISPGERYQFNFTSAGTFRYLCKHHAMQGMIGTITVTT
ncbi:MAG: plastocyanin/azurin family copper-binding protein [Devosia sp.]